MSGTCYGVECDKAYPENDRPNVDSPVCFDCLRAEVERLRETLAPEVTPEVSRLVEALEALLRGCYFENVKIIKQAEAVIAEFRKPQEKPSQLTDFYSKMVGHH